MADFHAAERSSLDAAGDPLSDPLSGFLDGSAAAPVAAPAASAAPAAPEAHQEQTPKVASAFLGGAAGSSGAGLFDDTPSVRPQKSMRDYGDLFGESTPSGGQAVEVLFGSPGKSAGKGAGSGAAQTAASKGDGSLFGSTLTSTEDLFGDAAVRPKALFDAAGIQPSPTAPVGDAPRDTNASTPAADEAEAPSDPPAAPAEAAGEEEEEESGAASSSGALPSQAAGTLKSLDPSKLKFKKKNTPALVNQGNAQEAVVVPAAVNEKLGALTSSLVDFSSLTPEGNPASSQDLWKQTGLEEEANADAGLFSASEALQTTAASAEDALLAKGEVVTGQGRSKLLNEVEAEDEAEEDGNEAKIEDLMVGKILEREDPAKEADELFGTSKVKMMQQRQEAEDQASGKESEAAALLKDEALLGPDSLLKDLEAATLGAGEPAPPPVAGAAPSDEDLFSMIGGSSANDIVGDASQFDFSSYINSQGGDQGSGGGLFS